MRIRKWLALLLTFTLAATVFAGCKGEESPPEGSPAPGLRDTTAVYDGTVKQITSEALPDGTEIVYTSEEGDIVSPVDIGTYLAEAEVTGEDGAIKTLTATLTVTENPDWVTLAVPKGLALDCKTLRWAAVPEAPSYKIDLGGQLYEAETNAFNLDGFEHGVYSARIRAYGGEGYNPSAYCAPYEFDYRMTPSEAFEQAYMTFTKDIAAVKIDTNGVPIVSKEVYVDAAVSIESPVEAYCVENLKAGIRGRGNTTWVKFDKKPYRIKFNKKTSLFGFKPVKNWALVANHSDKTFMRNYIAYMLGRSLDSMDFNPNIVYVEVYLNGDYNGLYCMTDQMESGPSRVDVEDYTVDANGNLTDLGFMVELDARATWPEENNLPGRDYFTIVTDESQTVWDHEFHFVLKYPKYDDDGFEDNPALYSQAFDFVQDYVNDMFWSVVNGEYERFLEICDRDSFIDFHLVQELLKNPDATTMSVYFNRKIGKKLQVGPLWDFDLALGNCDYIQDNIPGADSPAGFYIREINNFFRFLCYVPAFADAVRVRYRYLYENEIKYAIECIDKIAADIKPYAEKNFERWDILDIYLWPNPPAVVAANTFGKQVAYVKDFLTARADWLKEVCEDATQWQFG